MLLNKIFLNNYNNPSKTSYFQLETFNIMNNLCILLAHCESNTLQKHPDHNNLCNHTSFHQMVFSNTGAPR